ncbi:hypothetical protein HOD29_00545 [archaeon]|jgi:tRNA-uridine 2-sulfurtransferase|nr:hypothetical protein [archaeon]
MKQKPKILLAMSGGVDSSVAALILKKKGYDVHGAFMKNWSDTKNKITGQCAWVEERDHALKIAAKLEIPIITLDFEKEYKKLVVDEMFKKYKQGITPNPDIDCNREIKFPMLIKEAKKIGINLIATGHYARIKKKKYSSKFPTNLIEIFSKLGGVSIFWRHPLQMFSTTRSASRKSDLGVTNKDKISSKTIYELHRAKDETKDQSYFLYAQSQNDLAHTLFPIGNLTKKKVRKIAKKNNFQNWCKKGTVGICFIGKVNLKEFLSKKIKPKKGKILDPKGNKIGEHDGIYYYTIGQRLGPRYGFDLKRQDPKTKRMIKWYVAKKYPKTNTIIAAPEGHKILLRKTIHMKELHLIDIKKKDLAKRVKIRIRQVGELMPATIQKNKVILDKAITGVSEGQAIVFYRGTKCLGGAVIGF